ncbi:hypothetical protein SSX86_016347 [Deinandra increscens subsp. villosa]|uniref:Reverse transcriptase domain-containing protein n=1 Tax=Deinandra increscens subsp. villosa TaxID=3103831 RepID=A0AAP0GY01_9ASTR
MGFPEAWCTWIKGILDSTCASVLVNGSPTYQFKSEKGLRQGDPISPFLFLIVMECLSWLLNKAKELGLIKGISFPIDNMDINHLFFADDALILGEWSRENIQNTARILRIFYLCTGLRINIHKSNLFGIGVQDEEIDGMLEVLGCRRGDFPCVYLGIKVGAKMTRIGNWDMVLDILNKRLTSWKAKNLSMGGRVILIKSVLENLPIYYLSLYKAPKAVIESMEKIMRRFLWTGCNEDKKINWIAWDVITTPKKEGGLGLSKLEDVNDALLLKWAWRFKSGGNCLWKKVIIGCHGSSRNWAFLPCKASASGCWRQIVKLCDKKVWSGNTLGSHFEAIVGDGSTISFWMDSWLRDEPLRLTYPHLFRLEKHKWVVISDRLRLDNGVKTVFWDWKTAPSSAAEVSNLFNLLEELYAFDWLGGVDKWRWKPRGSGVFTVKSARTLLSHCPTPVRNPQMKWKGWTPLKCKILVWIAILNRLPTKVELCKRGVDIQISICGLCGSDTETSTHIFTGCFYAAEIWSRVENWCRLSPMIVFDVSDFLKIPGNQPMSKHAKYILRGIIYTSLWTIWIERNDRIFQNKRRRAKEVFESIRMTSYFWFKNRTNVISLDWKDWCNYPLVTM